MSTIKNPNLFAVSYKAGSGRGRRMYLDQRQEIIINVLGAATLKSHPKHMSPYLLFDNAVTECRVRDFHAFGEVGEDFPFQLDRVNYVHGSKGIRYRHQTQCNHTTGLCSAGLCLCIGRL